MPKKKESGSCGEKRYTERIFALFPYEGLGQTIVPKWKHNALRNCAAVFTPLLLSFLQQRPQLHDIPIVPVPPRPEKMQQKGWDQIEDIAVQIENTSNISVFRCLTRCNSSQQKKLSRQQRLQNLKGKIRLATKKTLPEKLIIIDDVRTTGTTIEICAQVLREHGCKCVYGLCLFFD